MLFRSPNRQSTSASRSRSGQLNRLGSTRVLEVVVVVVVLALVLVIVLVDVEVVD